MTMFVTSKASFCSAAEVSVLSSLEERVAQKALKGLISSFTFTVNCTFFTMFFCLVHG